MAYEKTSENQPGMFTKPRACQQGVSVCCGGPLAPGPPPGGWKAPQTVGLLALGLGWVPISLSSIII